MVKNTILELYEQEYVNNLLECNYLDVLKHLENKKEIQKKIIKIKKKQINL